MCKKPAKPEYRLSDTPFYTDGEVTFLKTSEGLGWTDVYAQVTHEGPNEAICSGVRDIWFVMPLQPVKMWRRTGLRQQQGLLAPDGIVVTGAGDSSHTLLRNSARALHVFIRAEVFEEVAREMSSALGAPSASIASAFDLRDRGLSLMLRGIKQALDDPADIARMKVEYLARAIAIHSFGHNGTWGAKDRHCLDNRRFKALVEYLQENLSSELCLDELAAAANLGRTAFIRQFKARTGQTPHQYVMLARIRKACDLLERTRLPLSQIAYACGYSDQAHMSSSFRRIVGLTPSRYRSEHF
ncbi:helix-turn-helix domain-containing protein [Pseudomonas sp. X10]